VPFLVVGRRVLLDGKPHIVGVGTDLTERKFAERAIKRLNPNSNAGSPSAPRS
jgi:hypothetical protein